MTNDKAEKSRIVRVPRAALLGIVTVFDSCVQYIFVALHPETS